MKLFLSYARKDSALARQLANCLTNAGFAVWTAENQIEPGENWAKRTGEALDEAQLMVILLTPGAMDSDSVRQNIEFAIGSRKFEGRVFSIFVGPTVKASKDMPWILLKLPHRQVQSARAFAQIAKEIKELSNDSSMSHSHA